MYAVVAKRVQPAQHRAGAARHTAAGTGARSAGAVRETQQRAKRGARGIYRRAGCRCGRVADGNWQCCRPAPPDRILGFVTRGKGMSIHRSDCATFQRMAARSPELVLETAWSADVMSGRGLSVYPVDLAVESNDRQGLLRDISEVFAREKMNVTGVKTRAGATSRTCNLLSRCRAPRKFSVRARY